MIRIRPATEADHIAISVLVVNVFRQPNESTMIKALRSSGSVAIELVAEEDEGLVGHVCLSWLDAPDGWLTLAPVSVRPQNQKLGVGAELIQHALDWAREATAQAVVVVGDPDYYGRFGFVFDGPAELASPFPKQYTGLLALAPETATIRAALTYPQPFAEV